MTFKSNHTIITHLWLPITALFNQKHNNYCVFCFNLIRSRLTAPPRDIKLLGPGGGFTCCYCLLVLILIFFISYAERIILHVRSQFKCSYAQQCIESLIRQNFASRMSHTVNVIESLAHLEHMWVNVFLLSASFLISGWYRYLHLKHYRPIPIISGISIFSYAVLIVWLGKYVQPLKLCLLRVEEMNLPCLLSCRIHPWCSQRSIKRRSCRTTTTCWTRRGRSLWLENWSGTSPTSWRLKVGNNRSLVLCSRQVFLEHIARCSLMHALDKSMKPRQTDPQLPVWNRQTLFAHFLLWIIIKTHSFEPCAHPQAIQDVDEFVSSSDLEKCCIASHCSEWVPSEWESDKTSQ